jgi:hypothetical protein
MKKKALLLTMVVFCAFVLFAQDKEEKKATVVESVYILPKKGMAKEFEKAVKSHNQKFHPEGDHVAGLRRVDYGDMAGWYVWIMGPTTYEALDTRPMEEDGHADDWKKNIDPLVQKYGPVNLWNYNSKLSSGMDILKKSRHYEVWGIFIKRGQYYRFEAIAEKLQKTSEKLGYAFLVFNNPLHTLKSPDVAMVWNFGSYADWAKDIGFKKEFEKQFGKGSWQNMFDEWLDIVEDYNGELRTFIK